MSIEAVENICMYLANELNEPARQLGYSIERISRPFLYGRFGYKESAFQEITTRIQQAVTIPFCLIACLAALPISIGLSLLGTLLQTNRIKVEKVIVNSDHKTDHLKIIDLNTCLQEGPFATLTGDVIHPLDRFDETHLTRISALAEFIGKQDADIFLGQEVHGAASMKILQEELKKQGYTTFISDRSAWPIYLNSGLYVALKGHVETKNIAFTPYPHKDRGGVNYGSLQGCLSFDVVLREKTFSIFTTHLAYGYTQKIDRIRENQLANHIFPKMKEKLQRGFEVILAGDFNQDKLFSQKIRGKPEGCTELVSSPNTRISSPGEIRGKQYSEEQVDAVFISLALQQGSKLEVIDPKIGGHFVTDHRALVLAIPIK